MTDPGLTNRLRQRSRRAGIMVGLSMALTIAVLIGGFAGIYARLNPYTSDFISQDVPTAIPPAPTATQPPEAADTAAGEDDESDSEGESDPPPEEEPTPTPEPEDAEVPAEVGDEFVATHLSNPNFSINFRESPGQTGTEIVSVLEQGTPLRFLGDEEVVSELNSELLWLRFETEDGEIGWMREVDTVEVDEDAEDDA